MEPSTLHCWLICCEYDAVLVDLQGLLNPMVHRDQTFVDQSQAPDSGLFLFNLGIPNPTQLVGCIIERLSFLER